MNGFTVIRTVGALAIVVGTNLSHSPWAILAVVGGAMYAGAAVLKPTAAEVEVEVDDLHPRAFVHPNGQGVVVFGDHAALVNELKGAGFNEVVS